MALLNQRAAKRVAADEATTASYPSAVMGWFFVVVLLAAYAVSFVDRQILNLLVEDLRADLAITDAQVGVLQGPAFGVFYAVMGLPFGLLADRINRVRVIAGGLLVWTLATLLGSIAQSFEMLLLSRMLVGAGEAALVPSAVSLLSDSFAPTRRALPLAIFTAGVSVGAGLALMLGGSLVRFAHDGAETLPLIGGWLAGRAPWQIVLALAGLGGVPLAILIAALPEPARRAPPPRSDTGAGLFAFIRRERSLFIPLLLGSALLYLFANALSAWMPTLFVRSFGWSPAAVGMRMGGLILVCALAGNLASGLVTTYLASAGHRAAPLAVMSAGAMLLAPTAIIAMWMRDPVLLQGALMLVYFAMSLCFGVATASFVAATPSPIWGRMIALYLLTGNLVGLGLGPMAVPFFLDFPGIAGANAGQALGSALGLVALCSALPGAILLRVALRVFRTGQTEPG
ncbi:MAG: MFS transporter [Novosphingobium sp.]